MPFRGKQQRLLKILDDVDEYGGDIKARRAVTGTSPYFIVDGWKNTQGAMGVDIMLTIGADFLHELVTRGDIRMERDTDEPDTETLTITDSGKSRLRDG